MSDYLRLGGKWKINVTVIKKNHSEFKELIEILKTSSCVLFVGPNLLRNAQNKTLEKALFEHLISLDEESNRPLVRNFFEEDGFLLLNKEANRAPLVRRMVRFYEQEHSEAEKLLNKLVKIPFSTIITLFPNDLLQKAFKAHRLDFHSDFYFRNNPKPPKPFIKPTSEKPLLYQMLGNISKPGSLVITHKDLFSYLESIFAQKNMSEGLRKHIQDTETIIFVGLPIEKWHTQLLLRVLYHISSRLETLEQYASMPATTSLNNIFKEEFNIRFITTEGPSFVDELYKLCEAEGILRIIPEESPKDRIIQQLDKAEFYFSRNKIQEGIQNLRDILNSLQPKADDHLAELTLLERNYHYLESLIVTQRAKESHQTEMNDVIFSLIKMIPKTKQLTKV